MLDLLIVAALGASIPITDDSVDAVCDETIRIDCAIPITPASPGASVSAPGFDVFISDVVWDNDGIEEGTGAFSGVAFDQTIVITDEASIPPYGMYGFAVACATPSGDFVRFVEDDWDDRSLMAWIQSGAPTSPASIQAQAANEDIYGYVEITDLCSADERRAVVGVGMWANSSSALSPGFTPGFENGDNIYTYEITSGGEIFSWEWSVAVVSAPSYGESGSLTVSYTCIEAPHGGYGRRPQLRVYDDVGDQIGQSVQGAACDTSTVGAAQQFTMNIVGDGFGSFDFSFNLEGNPVVYWAEGHPSHVEGDELLGWSATLAMSDALDDVVFIPGEDESAISQIPGMCVDWVDCVEYCDHAVTINPVDWLECAFVPPFDVTDVVDALREDLIQGPIVAYSRVLLSNAERVMSAVASAGEQCGPIASFDFGTIGEVDINTCDVPTGWRSLVRIVFSALISVASLMLVARLMLSAVGLQGVLDFGRHNGVDS